MMCISELCEPSTLLLGLLVALLVIWMLKGRVKKNFPPGPRGLPLVGYVPFLGKNPGEALMKLKAKYGPVMSVKIGSDTWVVLNDFATIHESLVRQGSKYSGRPSNYLFDIIQEGHGIAILDYGQTWKSLRKFGVTTLRGKKRRNYPPGPRGLPLLGYAPFLGTNPGESLRNLKGKYGPVISVQMGGENWVVLNDFATINEALVKQGGKFSGRPRNYIFDMFTGGYGIVGADYGRTWKSLRKFGLMTLRGFGVGKKSMETNVIEETSYLVEQLEAKDGGKKLRHKLTIAVSNIICRVVFGSRFEYNNDQFRTLIRVIDDLFSDSSESRLLGVIYFASGLRHFPFFRSVHKYALKELEDFAVIIRKVIQEHKDTYIENELRDFIDAFLKEIKEKGDGDPSFNERQLLQYIRDLFQAGTGTASSTLHWSIFALCYFPEIQEKLAEEVESIIGSGGTPTMKHRDQMPYTRAFIHEIMRLKTLVQLAVFHKTSQDASLCGYQIPKNTIVAPNLWAVHHDPETFKDPDSFRPERFLDKEGKFVKSSHVIPFSVGPRHCLGEQLAIVEIFIFLTSIVQKFKVIPEPDSKLPPFEESGQSAGFTFEGPNFEVVFEKR